MGTDYTRFGLVVYSTEAVVQFHLNRYGGELGYSGGETRSREDMLQYITHDVQYTPRGERDVARLLRRIRTQMFTGAAGDRTFDLNILVLVTAGLSIAGQAKTISEAVLVKQEGIHVITVGVGLSGQTQEVDAMASTPADINRYLIVDFTELDIIIPKLIAHICRGTKPFSLYHPLSYCFRY